MKIGRFRLGMRTTKTALAVFACILLFYLFDRADPMIATIAAVFALRQDMTSTVQSAKSRIIGNTVGSIAAMIFIVLQHYSGHILFSQLVVLPILVALVIIFQDGIDNNMGIITGIATLILIALSTPAGESAGVAFDRIIDTFIGTGIAIFINTFIKPPSTETQRAIEADLAQLKKQEKDLQTALVNVQESIQKKESKKKQQK
ncbi:MAG TPA: FUSC family protein [Tetragenococcus sp.]|nr:FUSC family protein [Tetragenococcus sp.]